MGETPQIKRGSHEPIRCRACCHDNSANATPRFQNVPHVLWSYTLGKAVDSIIFQELAGNQPCFPAHYMTGLEEGPESQRQTGVPRSLPAAMCCSFASAEPAERDSLSNQEREEQRENSLSNQEREGQRENSLSNQVKTETCKPDGSPGDQGWGPQIQLAKSLLHGRGTGKCGRSRSLISHETITIGLVFLHLCENLSDSCGSFWN
ncbi:uncharacterized protein LOC118233395 [Anguilla anguilla]|uniref:uncharacterized protein LOC118233395 n=1 Tax=Anguilla anguilla TaxID=7936 RepID=UPI0015B0E551|nr:uncharacterized protein LOC118233395 [Anguilla anguilla]